MAIPTPSSALTVSQAVALDLLADGMPADEIEKRTEITPDTLYHLAVQQNVPAPHGTIEGYGVHQARTEKPCKECAPLQPRVEARARAQQRKAEAALAFQHQAPHRRGRRALART
ncbi:hypothetical protein OG819_55165 [Streptomyces sp. NBC_01549]|uniref:hypothetical protein n=1 Tax=Streptomyces sp. NBC_01549 TaxID=2975874 RepID=UPI00224CDDB8|nr:hypothetical protein [Streptomyces sp. NBC_01549]MCX4598299.1 hypothetical protein [Streptomyces sp. NBC_01549]